MEAARLVTLVGFALAALWTPGPNNILLARSGAVFGFRRTVPHALGVALGFGAMLFAIALGMGEVFRSEPWLREGLRVFGIAVLLWLSWRIAFARWEKNGERRRRPFRFHEAVAFQWINPKAWVMVISVSAAYVTGVAPLQESLACALVFTVIGLSSSTGWTAFGVGIGRTLHTEFRRRVFGVVMGLLLAGCALALVLEDLSAIGE